jgi:hypothetical protein
MITKISHDQSRIVWAVEHNLKFSFEPDQARCQFITILSWPFTSLREGRCISREKKTNGTTLSPDGKMLCFMEANGHLCLANAVEGEIIQRIHIGFAGTAWKTAWSTDGSIVGALSRNSFVFFSVPDLRLIGSHGAKYPCSICFHPNGADVILGTWETSKIVTLRSLLNT